MLWYSLEAPCRGASNEYPQHMFSLRNKKNIMWIPPLICSYVNDHLTLNDHIQNTVTSANKTMGFRTKDPDIRGCL